MSKNVRTKSEDKSGWNGSACVKLADGLLKFVQKFSVVQGNGL